MSIPVLPPTNDPRFQEMLSKALTPHDEERARKDPRCLAMLIRAIEVPHVGRGAWNGVQ